MFNHVISLKSSVERRQHIEKYFGEQNIPYSFFNAFQPNEENEHIIQQYVPSLNKTDLTIGEKGCFMSHVLLWQKCIDENLPFIAIFEDDIILSPVAHQFLGQYDWLKERFDVNQYFILRLETYLMNSAYRKTKIKFFQQRCFPQLMSQQWGTAGYIISQIAAKNLLDLFKSPYFSVEPIDVILFESLLKEEQYPVYQISPAIVIQDNVLNQNNCKLTSVISVERAERERERERERESKNNKKARRNLWRSISREIGRFRRRLKRKLNGWRIVKFL
ncbi:glycosyltransferase family 25 protein [Histophilus somni]|uniref:glycosyltransferase family 25 protein n=1 Tax=Histophilus somni TaxID=731 RepID=UPI0010725091|nr:glycosyltransferase family 25 protein [Histophilus somni]TFI33877.1 glycosyltransferase family 25 protein [Histophilus somni]